MPSYGHQFIADMIVRKMNLDKYTVISYDGQTTSQDLPNRIPQAILRHRPDIIAVNKKSKIAIGESKTVNDFTIHTQEQIADFYSTGFKLYLGIPKSAESKLEEVLKILDIPIKKISIIKVPDRLLISDGQ